MSSLRGIASTSLLLRQAFAAPRISQIRTVYRPAGATPSPIEAKQAAKAPQRYSRPINDEIEADIIQIVNQDGQLDVPTRKSNVIFSMRRNEQVLVQLDPGGPDRPAVCKIMPLADFRDEERAKEKAARLAKHSAKTSTKQIELNWSIDPHDLSHRLKKLSGFIEKGRTVEIILTKKRGKRMATADEIKLLMDKLRTAIEEANAHQIKPMDGEIGKTLTITVEKKK
ncbi:translation initiation factor IF3, putative [Talaromyces stipitatus ATCC 10500]|uniref:Translation initiation factor IF3, putative n=1 Tax=Talaromyces stipitatus (strain ATCC 10500 / CBS 375.48 / QM 6759 / NRRL 1006) TaxID=441959 RepID=B8MK48_TALSN|nr:translation initiation factor IF3, putative [Talaromyces stipitatus ATCC 10500]EED14865.1 translation initiation factor IF3, putative [Talaromyces stipitatus ATCC 10500]